MIPDQFTNQELMLDVGDGHQLYIQDWGDTAAKTTVIALHGGPGGGTSDHAKHNYDPAKHRVIFFDQRGSGKSTPRGSIEHNTTNDLVEDISKIADHLQIERFVLAGRSWGSCLALCYAIKHPQRVTAVVTGGMLTGNAHELDFADRVQRYKTFFPEAWNQLLENTPTNEHAEPIIYHLKQVLGQDEAAVKQSAYIYSNFIVQLLKLDDRSGQQDFETFDPAGIIIEAHYKLHNVFLEEDYIRNNAPKLTMPIWIVQGRYDMLCTPEIAYKLDQALPNSNLIWTTAGHTGSDRATADVTKTVLLGLA